MKTVTNFCAKSAMVMTAMGVAVGTLFGVAMAAEQLDTDQKLEQTDIALTSTVSLGVVSDILPLIEDALSDRGLTNDMEIEFANPDASFQFVGPAPALSHLSYNPRSGRFVARIKSQSAVSIGGFVKEHAFMPVLTSDISRGQTIAESDIQFEKIAITNAERLIANADNLIGMEARRPLTAGVPVRKSDVVSPMLIRKGDLISLVYSQKGIRLTHQGLAMASGANGDVIAVRNPRSNRELNAVVIAKDKALIGG